MHARVARCTWRWAHMEKDREPAVDAIATWFSTKDDGFVKPAKPCLPEDEEPAMCHSPERRFDEKERRERPPRRYDKVKKTTSVA